MPNEPITSDGVGLDCGVGELVGLIIFGPILLALLPALAVTAVVAVAFAVTAVAGVVGASIAISVCSLCHLLGPDDRDREQ